MKIQLVLLAALVALAYSEDEQAPPMFQMPSLPFPMPNMNMKDIQGALKQLENMTPEMKDRMFSMAKSFGMDTDDLQKKLEEHMPQIKQMLHGAEEVVEEVAEEEEDKEDSDLASMVTEKLQEMGLPSLENIMPMVKNMLINQVRSMGVDIDEENPEKSLVNIQKKVDEFMGINEDDDPDARQEKYQKALLKMVKDAGMGIDTDDFEEAQDQINEMLQTKLEEAGLGDIDPTDPEQIQEVLVKKMKDLGVPIDQPKQLIEMCKEFFRENAMDFLNENTMGFIKEHLMGYLGNMNGENAMDFLKEHAMGFLANMNAPQPPMPQMPHMMPPQMHMPPQYEQNDNEDYEHFNAGPINLNLHINVDPAEVTAPQTIMMMPPHMMRQQMMRQQPMQPMQQPPMPQMSLQEAIAPAVVPRYLRGAESVIMHVPMMGEDDEVARHIMNLQSSLNNGEIPEEALMELMEDLMKYRLKAKVMMVRNMYLNAHMEAMQKQMQAPPMPHHPVMRLIQAQMPAFLGSGSFGHSVARQEMPTMRQEMPTMRQEMPTMRTQSPILNALLARMGQ